MTTLFRPIPPPQILDIHSRVDVVTVAVNSRSTKKTRKFWLYEKLLISQNGLDFVKNNSSGDSDEDIVTCNLYVTHSYMITRNPVALQPYRALADRAAAAGQRS